METLTLNHSRLVQSSFLAVRIVIVLNRIFLGACLIGFTAAWIFPGWFSAWIGQTVPAADVASRLAGMRDMALTGILMAIASDRLLILLADIITTVSAGDPFIPANAIRLRTIGWYLVVLQLVNIPAALIGKVYPGMRSTPLGLNLSISGWMAILMVFVLSRVFAAGSAMRDDLEGTV
jgi:hypothetical protein